MQLEQNQLLTVWRSGCIAALFRGVIAGKGSSVAHGHQAFDTPLPNVPVILGSIDLETESSARNYLAGSLRSRHRCGSQVAGGV